MFEPKKYEQFARKFAELATGDSPERVFGLSGGQEMADQASQHGAVAQMVRLLHDAVWRKGLELGVNWTAVRALELMAQQLDPGGIYVAVCPTANLPSGTGMTLTFPVRGMRLFHFAAFTGNELICRLAPVVSDWEWERRIKELSRRKAEQQYNDELHAELTRYVLTARSILAGIVNSHPHAQEAFGRLCKLADRLDAAAPGTTGSEGPVQGLLELLDESKGLNEASRLVFELILALKLKPSKVFAQIEAQLITTP